MEEELKLFKVTTRGCGVFRVVATTFDEAAAAVSDELNSQDYGYSGDRLVTGVEFECRQQWMRNGKRALYGDDDENHLIIYGTADPYLAQRRYAEQCENLEKEIERWKAERKHVYVRQRFDHDFFKCDDEQALREAKLNALVKVSHDIGCVLADAGWTYVTTTEESDGIWVEMGMYVNELPEDRRGQTSREFLGDAKSE